MVGELELLDSTSSARPQQQQWIRTTHNGQTLWLPVTGANGEVLFEPDKEEAAGLSSARPLPSPLSMASATKMTVASAAAAAAPAKATVPKTPTVADMTPAKAATADERSRPIETSPLDGTFLCVAAAGGVVYRSAPDFAARAKPTAGVKAGLQVRVWSFEKERLLGGAAVRSVDVVMALPCCLR